MTSDLAVIDAPQQAIVPLNDMERMSEVVAASGLFGIKDRGQALALMLIAQAEGRHPATIARDYDIIQGRPSKKAEALMRDFIASAGKVEWKQLDDTAADAVFSHPAGGSIQIRWDLERARQAGLGGKDMWKKYPRQMLRSRCISEGIRTVCPMVTSGMYVPEEAYDMEPAPPPPVVSTQPAQSTPAPVAPARPKEEARQPAPAPVKDDGTGAIYVSDVKVYEGTGKNDKPYTKYTVTLSDGTAGSTFDAGLGALAQEAQDQVKAVIAEFGPQPSNPTWKPDLKDLQLAMDPPSPPAGTDPLASPIETTVRKFEQRNANGGVVYAIETDHGRFGTADAQIGTSLMGSEGKLMNIEWRETDRGREIVKALDLEDAPF